MLNLFVHFTHVLISLDKVKDSHISIHNISKILNDNIIKMELETAPDPEIEVKEKSRKKLHRSMNKPLPESMDLKLFLFC